MTITGIMHIGGEFFDEKSKFFRLDRLKQVVDKTIVLVDRLDINVDADMVIKISAKDKEIKWNDYANKYITLLSATNMGSDWIFRLDSDEDFDYRLKNRDDLAELIDEAEYVNCNVISMPLREMWEKPDEYRSDGIWGKKRRNRIVKNFLNYDDIIIKNQVNKRLHFGPWPSDYQSNILKSNYEIYHYGCYTEELRKQRIEKYKKEDDNNTFQKSGYEYILDYNNLQTTKIDGIII